MESTKVETNENPTLNKAYVMLQLPDGILWKKAAEYAKQFAIKDKPVESSKLMSDAQDHYYRGLIECRRLLSVNLT